LKISKVGFFKTLKLKWTRKFKKNKTKLAKQSKDKKKKKKKQKKAHKKKKKKKKKKNHPPQNIGEKQRKKKRWTAPPAHLAEAVTGGRNPVKKTRRFYRRPFTPKIKARRKKGKGGALGKRGPPKYIVWKKVSGTVVNEGSLGKYHHFAPRPTMRRFIGGPQGGKEKEGKNERKMRGWPGRYPGRSGMGKENKSGCQKTGKNVIQHETRKKTLWVEQGMTGESPGGEVSRVHET